MSLVRLDNNPLITPADVKPSREDFEVVCAFNAGATLVNDEVLLLLRIAERPKQADDELVAPVLHAEDVSQGIDLLRVKKSDPEVEEIDSRVFSHQGNPYLTSISHMRIARSRDGQNFDIDDTPAMVASIREEEFGIEDPRITKIDDTYYINYSAISRMGVSTGLASTKDFVTFERQGIIFVPDNRDVTIFPEKVGGHYVCYHRPASGMFKRADMWLAKSPDLLHWGDNRFVATMRPGMWDNWRIGGGAVPIKTDRGWLEIYHGADQDQRYCLGAMLAELDHPENVISRSKDPILTPDAPYESEGFFGNVVFTCGAVAYPNGRVLIYYGAADECIAGAETSIDDLLKMVG